MIGGQVSSITACMFELSRMVVSPNEAKSFASTLFFMSSISLGKYSCRDLYSHAVAAVRLFALLPFDKPAQNASARRAAAEARENRKFLRVQIQPRCFGSWANQYPK